MSQRSPSSSPAAPGKPSLWNKVQRLISRDDAAAGGLTEAASSAAARAPDPALIEARKRDAEIDQLLAAGKLGEAVDAAREWQRVSYDDLHDHRRYHRVLLRADKPAVLQTHTQDFITLLLKHQRVGEAVEAFAACIQRLPDFALQDADATLLLAQHAWKELDNPTTLALLRGYDKRFPAHPRIPEAYELIVRVLKQGMGRGDQALKIYKAMRKRHPDHPSTKELAWVLRDELATPAPQPQPGG